MLLWILSDLHLELSRWDLPAPADRPRFDVLIVAGDLVPGPERGVRWLAERVPDRPVVYAMGNHEFYGGDEFRAVEKAKAAAEGTSVRVLQNETAQFGDLTVAVATLWTDFDLFGDQPRAMFVAGERMNDFRRIRTGRYTKRFRPHHALARHMESRAFFETELRRPRANKLCLISHHCPLPPVSVRAATPAEPLSADELLAAAYYSDLTPLMNPAPDDGRGVLRPADLWVFGHTHQSVDTTVGVTADTTVGATRVVSNGKGYGPWPGRLATWDNPNFNPNYIVEI